jgi:hypothetical protein
MKAVLLWSAVLANVALTAFVVGYPVLTAPGPWTALVAVLGARLLVPLDLVLIVVAVVCSEGPPDPPPGPVAPGKSTLPRGGTGTSGPRLFDATYGLPKVPRPPRPGGAA